MKKWQYLSVKYLRKKIILKFDFRLYILAVTHFVTQFTHVFIHPRILNRKQTKKLENLFENLVSDLWEKAYVSTKLLLK